MFKNLGRVATQKVIEQLMPMLGKYRFRVELYTLNVEFAMTKPHNGLSLTLFGLGPGSYFKAIGQRFGVYDQTVVASSNERIR